MKKVQIMDTIMIVGYIIGGILFVGLALAIIYVIGLAFLMAISEIFLGLLSILGDVLFSVFVFPFYLLFHPIKLFTNTKEFFREFYIKLPNAGANLRFERELQKERERRAKMTPEERAEEDARRHALWEEQDAWDKKIRDFNIACGKGMDSNIHLD